MALLSRPGPFSTTPQETALIVYPLRRLSDRCGRRNASFMMFAVAYLGIVVVQGRTSARSFSRLDALRGRKNP